MSRRTAVRRTLTVILFACLALILGSTNPSAKGGGEEKSRKIRLSGREFDPRVSIPALPPELRSGPPVDDRPAYYLVQFSDRILPSMRRELEEAGAVVLHFVHENAYIVRADPPAMHRVERLSSVRWTGPYEPGYALGPQMDLEYDAVLNRELEAGRRPGDRPAPRIDTSSRLAVRILTMEPPSVPGLAGAAKRSGGSGIQKSEHGAGLVRAEIPRSALKRLAREPGVLWIERELPTEVMNDVARWTIQSHDEVNLSAPAHAYGLTGAGQVVTISDSGLDYDHEAFFDDDPNHPHPDHRKVTAYYTPQGGAVGDGQDNGATQHGTHVGGTVAGDAGAPGQYDGDGVDWGPEVEKAEPHDGQAFEATLNVQDISNDPEGRSIRASNDLAYHYAEAKDPNHNSWIITNSWGTLLFAGEYTGACVQTDSFIWTNPAFTVLFAAGNSGPSSGTINTFAVAKNLIAVGASGNGPDSDDLAFNGRYFSSHGPAVDGRIKPDLMAPGQSLWSARGCDGYVSHTFPPKLVCPSPADQDTYKPLSGTSMATPTAAGAAALVRQYYMEGWYPDGNPATGSPINPPSAALIKATLINSAVEMTGPGAYANGELKYPNNSQGWGRILLDEALVFPGDTRRMVVDDNPGIATNQTNSYQFDVGSRFESFKVTLVWSDHPDSAHSSPDLVNDLDLVVTSPNGTTYRGNVFVGYNPGESKVNPSAEETDHLNNVEEVLVLSGIQPGTWTIQVGGFVPMGNAGLQPYALVMTGRQVSSLGVLEMDRQAYTLGPVNLGVSDADRNQNPGVAETITAQITSTTETSPLTITLTEVGVNSGVFEGPAFLSLGTPAVPGDGLLQVQNADQLTASYFDADDGSGGSGTRQAHATIDVAGPAISGVGVTQVRPTWAVIDWTTDEPATSVIEYGASIPTGASAASNTFQVSHSLRITGLQPGTLYHFLLRSTDDLGNTGSDDNGGTYYSLLTPEVPPPDSSIQPDWPSFQNNSAHVGASSEMMVPPFSSPWPGGPLPGGTTFVVGEAAVASGGIVYSSVNGRVRAVHANDGSVLWEHPTLGDAGQGATTPVVSGGVVYVPLITTVDDPQIGLVQRGFIYALDAQTGEYEAFTYAGTISGIDTRFKIVVEGGRIYTTSSTSGVVIAFNVDGTMSWIANLFPKVAARGATVGDGKLFVPSFSQSAGLIALDLATGAELWSTELQNARNPGHVPLFAEDTVYLGTSSLSASGVECTMTALNVVDGSIRWQVDGLDQTEGATPAYDGSSIYFTTSSLNKYGRITYMALDAASGEGLWATVLPVTLYGASGPLAYADGLLYGVADDGILRAVDAGTGAVVAAHTLGGPTSRAPVAISGRTIFALDFHGDLYAIQAQDDLDDDNDGDPDTSDCAPLDPGRNHAASELCNSFDDNCDDVIDDLGTTTCGVGECQQVVENCVDGQPQTCQPGTPSAEVCNGVDDDCDGSVDDGLGFSICGVGACQHAVQNCHQGVPNECIPYPPTNEVCNNIDDDCDGVVDDNLGTITCGTGACQVTVQSCVNGSQQTCTPGTPGVEGVSVLRTCFDSVDNDCDGATDLDCAVEVTAGSQTVTTGTITSGTLNDLRSNSANQTYEAIAEAGSSNGKQLCVIEGFSTSGLPAGSVSELRVEGFRNASSNDTFLFAYSTAGSAPSCTATNGWTTTSLAISKTADDDQLQATDLGGPSSTLWVRMKDSKTSQDSQVDTLTLDRLFAFPSPIAMSDYASAADKGTVLSGTTFSSTHTSNNGYEQFQEVLSGGVSRLVHTWKFTNVPAGSSHKLHVEGNRVSTGGDQDNFQFYWSTVDPAGNSSETANFTSIGVLVASSNDTTSDTAFGPGTLSGTIYIRVIDTRTTTGTVLDTLNVDHLAITTVP